MKKVLLLALCVLTLASCADSKKFNINGKETTAEPYGWFDPSKKNDSINYQVNVPNVVLSVVFCETVVVPLLLTGDQLFEPVSKK
jgi:type IV pilus biogenesis protein CpaD/CtpE